MSIVNTLRNTAFKFATFFRLGVNNNSAYIGDIRNGPEMIERYEEILEDREKATVHRNKNNIYISQALNKYDKQIREWKVENAEWKNFCTTTDITEHIGKLEILSDLEELEKDKAKLDREFFLAEKDRLFSILGEDAITEYKQEEETVEAYYKSKLNEPVQNRCGFFVSQTPTR